MIRARVLLVMECNCNIAIIRALAGTPLSVDIIRVRTSDFNKNILLIRIVGNEKSPKYNFLNKNEI